MLVKKAYKFRLYPTKEQEIRMAKTIGCSRFVFNHFLGKWIATYKETGKGLSYTSCSRKKVNRCSAYPFKTKIRRIKKNRKLEEAKNY